MTLPIDQIIQGDCLEIIPTLPKAKMIFADPPDNLGLKYNGFDDKWSSPYHYIKWLKQVIDRGVDYSEIFWFSHYYRYLPDVLKYITDGLWPVQQWKLFLWRFTFGQHNNNDCANGYRPIVRLMSPPVQLYPGAIRVESQRQRNNDKRANPKGRVPDDVWEFSRVCGTFAQRRQWHPNQHPEALIERMVKFSCKPGDLVIDMFAGTGTVNRVCRELGVGCIGIEISKFYCDKINQEKI